MRDLGAALVGLMFVGFVACSGPKSDDDDDDDGGESGNGASGGTTSSGGSGGTTSSGGTGATGGTGAVGSGGCQTICNRANACEKPAGVTFDLNSCITGCTEAVPICPAEMDDYVGCYLGLSNICVVYDTSSTACSTEVNAYVECMLAYCTDHTSAAVCN